MKPILPDFLFLFFGGAGCLVLLSGCGLVTLYLLAAHRPQPGAAVRSWDNDALVMDDLFSGWPVRLLMVGLGGSLLLVACFLWAGRVLVPPRLPAVHLSAGVDSLEPRAVNLFPWD